MEVNSEKNSRRVLSMGVLFAAIGIVALVIALVQPMAQDERARNADDIFDSTYTVEEKAEILASVSASSTGATIPEEEKLRVLEALQAQ